MWSEDLTFRRLIRSDVPILSRKPDILALSLERFGCQPLRKKGATVAHSALESKRGSCNMRAKDLSGLSSSMPGTTASSPNRSASSSSAWWSCCLRSRSPSSLREPHPPGREARGETGQVDAEESHGPCPGLCFFQEITACRVNPGRVAGRGVEGEEFPVQGVPVRQVLGEVSSLPMLFTGRWVSTDRGSLPRERRWSCPPCFPNSLRSRSAGTRLRSPMVATPIRLRALNVTAPTPQSLVIGAGARNSRVFSWATQTSPSGLPRSEAIFATNYVEAIPAETVRPTSFRTRPLDLPGDRLRAAEEATRPRHVQEALVDRQRLHEGGEPAEDLEDDLRHLLVSGHPHGQEDSVGAEPHGGSHRLGGVNAEGSGLVRGGRDDPRSLLPPTITGFPAREGSSSTSTDA